MTIVTPKLDLKSISISHISSRESVRRFICGVQIIDRWVCDKAFKHHCADRSRVFCATLKGSQSAIGFYALSFSPVNSELLLNQDADRYKDGHAPFIYIDWLAVQRSMQCKGIGTMLLMNALQRAYLVSRSVAIYGVALRSLNNRTREKYENHGFVVREESENPLMILPIWILRDLFDQTS